MAKFNESEFLENVIKAGEQRFLARSNTSAVTRYKATTPEFKRHLADVWLQSDATKAMDFYKEYLDKVFSQT